MPAYILDITKDANEDLSYYRAFERKDIVDVAEADDFDQEVEQLRNSLASSSSLMSDRPTRR